MEKANAEKVAAQKAAIAATEKFKAQTIANNAAIAAANKAAVEKMNAEKVAAQKAAIAATEKLQAEAKKIAEQAKANSEAQTAAMLRAAKR